MAERVEAPLLENAIDNLPINLAIVNQDGEIVRTNESWADFGRDNDLEGTPEMIGVNYLSVCDASGEDEFAQAAAGGIRDVLSGERDEFTLEYPCHSPTERRWFLMRASPFDRDGDRFAVVAHTNITDRKLAELEVEETAAELDEQREMLALLNQIVRHDIRNDMNVIKGWTETLASRLDGEDREVLEKVMDSAEHVIDLTRTVGDLAELITGEPEELQSVELEAILDSELEKAELASGGLTDELELVHPDEIPDVQVYADEMLSSVFSNLLKNAILHNDKAVPRIEVSVTVDSDTVTVEIADNGPGIPEDQRETVFGRGEKGLESPGSGLGLYLVDTLVDRYGGSVEIRDNDPEGTVFAVELRRAT